MPETRRQVISEHQKAMPFEILEITEVEVNGKKFPVVRGIFQRADEINGNDRVYSYNIVNREVGRLASRLASKKETTTYMLADHPHDGVSKITDAAGMIQDISLNPTTKNVEGSIRILGTRVGKDLLEILRAEGTVGISARGFGTMKPGKFEGKDAQIVQDDWRLKTYDFVLGQSHKGAITSNLSEQALDGLDEGDEMEKDAIKALTLDDLRAGNPDLVTSVETAAVAKEKDKLETAAKEQIKNSIADATKTMQADFDKKLSEAVTKAKTEAGSAEIDEPKLKTAAEKLGFTVIKGGVKTETEKALEGQLTEVKSELKTAVERLNESDKEKQKNALKIYVGEKSKGYRFRAALENRLTERCGTTAEVDEKLESTKKMIEKEFSEGATGKGEGSSREPNGSEGSGIAETTKVTTSSGLVLEMTQEQRDLRERAGVR